MLLERDPPVDWQQILLDLIRSGWKLRHIAMALNAPPGTVQRWWGPRRSEPRYEYGRALLKLHAEVKKNALATVHTTPAAYKGTRQQGQSTRRTTECRVSPSR